MCANRLLVQDGIYDRCAERFLESVQALQVSNGSIAQSTQGSLMGGLAVRKVEELVSDALTTGGKVLSGGRRHALGGSFYEPTVIGEAVPAMRFAHEEIFGPVAPLHRFSTEEEPITMANNAEYGLGGLLLQQGSRPGLSHIARGLSTAWSA